MVGNNKATVNDNGLKLNLNIPFFRLMTVNGRKHRRKIWSLGFTKRIIFFLLLNTMKHI